MIELNTVHNAVSSDNTYFRWNDRRRTVTPVGESVTDTSFGNDTDINKIVEKFHRTGEMLPIDENQVYQDVTNLQGDLAEMLTKTAEVRAQLETAKHERDELAKQQAVKDAEELARLRALQAAQEATGAEAPEA